MKYSCFGDCAPQHVLGSLLLAFKVVDQDRRLQEVFLAGDVGFHILPHEKIQFFVDHCLPQVALPEIYHLLLLIYLPLFFLVRTQERQEPVVLQIRGIQKFFDLLQGSLHLISEFVADEPFLVHEGLQSHSLRDAGIQEDEAVVRVDSHVVESGIIAKFLNKRRPLVHFQDIKDVLIHFEVGSNEKPEERDRYFLTKMFAKCEKLRQSVLINLCFDRHDCCIFFQLKDLIVCLDVG